MFNEAVSPKASQLGIHFSKNRLQLSSEMGLHKGPVNDTQLVRRSMNKKIKRTPAFGGIRTHGLMKFWS